jgi:hypothetical protein
VLSRCRLHLCSEPAQHGARAHSSLQRSLHQRPGSVLRRLRARQSDACTHLCAETDLLWVCGMEQGWGILQVEHPPAEASWRNPNVYYDARGPPSPSRTRAGSCYGSDGLHCLSPNETHIPVGLHEQHNNNNHGWVPMTTEIAAVWPQVVSKLVKGEMRIYADATWGW